LQYGLDLVAISSNIQVELWEMPSKLIAPDGIVTTSKRCFKAQAFYNTVARISRKGVKRERAQQNILQSALTI